MCTVSIVQTGDGFRLACNRDELHTRPPALPPVTLRRGSRVVVYPVDPQSRGTWIGVNDSGLACTLLNGPRDPSLPLPAHSRGLIVPRILEFDSAARAAAFAGALDVRLFQPFRLVMLKGRSLVVIASDGRRLTVDWSEPDAPRVFTSSSLGDAAVEALRRGLFERMVVAAGAHDRLRAQARFHAHCWPDRPQVSVLMSRRGASTVSRSVVDVRHASIRLTYMPIERVERAA